MDVRYLIVSGDDSLPLVHICDVCVLLAVHALADKLAGKW